MNKTKKESENNYNSADFSPLHINNTWFLRNPDNNSDRIHFIQDTINPSGKKYFKYISGYVDTIRIDENGKTSDILKKPNLININ